jgi:hypothetical protein
MRRSHRISLVACLHQPRHADEHRNYASPGSLQRFRSGAINILDIFAYYHDSAACFVCDGSVVAAFICTLF